MECYIGTIMLFAFSGGANFPPMGFLVCDGSTVAVNQYQALNVLLGGKYGPSDANTFTLPDLSKASPISGAQYAICAIGLWPYSGN